MVKVLPNNFTLFDSQRILSPAGEPLAITCSNDLLFIAVEECMVEVYNLCTLDQLAQFRTVSPVVQIAYNIIGDSIVTLERKHSLSHGFVRVYFKWRGLSADKPMRIRMASAVQRSLPGGRGRVAAEIVELPSDAGGSVSCLACCEYTGRIVVAMGSLLRVFYLEKEEEMQANDPSFFSLRSSVPTKASSPLSPSNSLPLPLTSSPSTPNIEILLDIQTNTTQLEMVSIVGDYIAFISSNEVRVVKLSLFHSGPDPIPDYEGLGNRELQLEGGVASEGGENLGPRLSRGQIVRDRNFLLWSPSAVWEAEKRAHSSSTADHVTSPISPAHNSSRDSHVTPPHLSSNAPLVGTVHLKSITQAISEKTKDRATMEVLGPVEYVWGHPLTVRVNHVSNDGCHGIPECRVLTMLYRRFSAESTSRNTSSVGGASLSLGGVFRGQRSTLPVRVQGGRRLGGEGGWDGLHSVQLIPTFAPSPESAQGSRSLVGVSCFLANRFHSYLYDVHRRCRLLSSFSFMAQSRLAYCDGRLLHALSDGSVETYTSRAFQAAISNLPRGSPVIPPPAEETGGWAEFLGVAGSEKGGDSLEEGEKGEGGRDEGEKGEGGREDGEGEGGREEGENGEGGREEGEKGEGGRDEGEKGEGGREDGEGEGGREEGENGEGGRDEGEKGEGGRDEGENGEGGRDEGEKGEGGRDEGEKGEGGRDEGEKGEGGRDEGEKGEGGRYEGENDEGGRDEGEKGEGGREEGENGEGGREEGEGVGGRDEGENGEGGREEGEGVGGRDEGENGEGGREEGEKGEGGRREDTNHTNCLPGSPTGSVGEDGKVTVDPETWLRQPIPPHDLDLTLVSTSKFIGCCYLATSQDYVIVVTKGEVETPSPSSGASWLLQSLTLRKTKAEQMWNIYILRLKSSISLYQQFMEFAGTMKESSPPMRQHLLSEAHVLLRRQILRGEVVTAEVMRWLQDNCFHLAESLCLYSRWNGIETHASHYFILSGRPIVDVLRHIISNHKPDNKRAYSILMAYLNLTLFEPRNAEKQMPLLRPLGDKVLELYGSGHVTRGSSHVTQRSSHVTGHVISLLLDSWLVGYSSDRAIHLCEKQLEHLTGEESCRGRMCHVMMCLRAGRAEEAKQGIRLTPKADLEKWMAGNVRLVLDSSNLTLSPLGKIVLELEEGSFLNLFLHFLKNHKMTFDDICTVLKTRVSRDLAAEHALKHFVEMIVLDRSKVISKTTTMKAVVILVEILFARLLSTATTDPHSSSSSRKQTPFVMRGARHRWLDNVVPFGEGGVWGEGEEGNGQETVGRKHDYRLGDLLQLQTLLCSSHMTDTVATRVDELLTSLNPAATGGDIAVYQISLQMLSWPRLGRKREACQLCLSHSPGAINDYCTSMFPHDLDMWVWLLEQLLGNAHYEGEPTPLQDLYTSLYKEALGHLLALTTPHEFISLLPPTGSVHFFLPFIERSFKLHFSRATSDHLHDSILHSHKQ